MPNLLLPVVQQYSPPTSFLTIKVRFQPFCTGLKYIY